MTPSPKSSTSSKATSTCWVVYEKGPKNEDSAIGVFLERTRAYELQRKESQDRYVEAVSFDGSDLFKIVCLVGSVKQRDDWLRYTARLTALGYVVLEAGLYGTVDEDIVKETWDLVGKVHFQKIRMADMVALIRKPDGTVGKDTQADIDYAKSQNKPIIEVDILTKGKEEYGHV